MAGSGVSMSDDVIRMYHWLIIRRGNTVEDEIALCMRNHRDSPAWYHRMVTYTEAVKTIEERRWGSRLAEGEQR